jgi:predicted phage terminase large subunit-like protein
MTEEHSFTDGELLALGRDDLSVYARALWRDFELARHIDASVGRLEAAVRGESGRQIHNWPPRHGKTKLAQLTAAWALGRRPSSNVVFASYSQEIADDSGRAIRDFVADPRHAQIFPACKVSDVSAAAHRFSTTKGGTFFSVGRGGSLTGRGADLLIIDDSLKDLEEARSPAVRRQLQEWYQSVAYTRLSTKGAIVLLGTRWHLDDLPGWLLREHAAEGWEVLSYPAIAGSGDLLGRAEGEALWPEHFPLERLSRIKATLGGALWSSLYQQNPTAAEGVVFKREWWRTYRDLPQTFERKVLSADTAFKATDTADYSALTVWGQAAAGFYLLHAWRGRVEFPELKRIVVSLAAQWSPNAIIIEDRASGQSLIQELQSGTSLPVLAVSADKDKVTRASAVTPTIEAGRVFLPESAPWLDEYLDELSSFPAAPHDDYVDSTTQALNWLRPAPTAGIIDYYDRLLRPAAADGAAVAQPSGQDAAKPAEEAKPAMSETEFYRRLTPSPWWRE